MDFKKEFNSFQNEINEYIDNLIEEKDIEKTIKDAMNYSLLAKGKRVRPTLVLSITKALNGDTKKALPFAAAIECIHTYSLIHDDLPAMDDDSLRRGVPTNHMVFGEANAILAGDGLLNLAFEIILNEIEKSSFEDAYYYSKAGKVISRSSGIKGMISGQIIDIESERKKISLETLLNMHKKKTGALIKASCIVGALIAKREDLVEELESYGENIGLAFQIIDDILDCTVDSKDLGKNAGSDEENLKSTFVTILGIEKSKDLAKKCTESAMTSLNKIEDNEFLLKFTEYLLNRKK